jgi:hypothetical protein
MKRFTTIFILCVFAFSFALKDEFKTLLSRNKMCFVSPRKMKEIPALKNPRMNYEKAFKHKKKKFEVRYAIRPFDKLFAEYQRSKKDSFYMADPNTFFKTSFTVTMMNVSDGKDYSYSIFDTVTSKKEFNADWAATTIVDTGKDFGMGYKYCMIFYMFRRDAGEAYTFYMADEKQLLVDLSAPIAHSLMFKP